MYCGSEDIVKVKPLCPGKLKSECMIYICSEHLYFLTWCGIVSLRTETIMSRDV